jgi:hypothetical protein
MVLFWFGRGIRTDHQKVLCLPVSFRAGQTTQRVVTDLDLAIDVLDSSHRRFLNPDRRTDDETFLLSFLIAVVSRIVIAALI